MKSLNVNKYWVHKINNFVSMYIHSVLNLPPQEICVLSHYHTHFNGLNSRFSLFEDVPLVDNRKGTLSLLHWLKANLVTRVQTKQGWNKCYRIWISEFMIFNFMIILWLFIFINVFTIFKSKIDIVDISSQVVIS